MAAAAPKSSSEVLDPHAPPKIVRSQEEIDKMAERLYTRDMKKILAAREEYMKELDFKLHHNEVRHVKAAAPLSPREEAAVKSCYTQALERKARTNEKLSEKFSPAKAATKTVTPEELEQIADRLCNQSMKHKSQLLETTEKKIYGAPQETKILDKEALAANAKSVYYEAMEKKKKSDAKLAEKYLFNRRDPHPEKLTPEQIAELGKRLSTKSGKV